MKVSIIGAGYVGLVSGACLADMGHEVTCVDKDPAKLAAINAAKSPLHEEGLEALLQRNVGQRLFATGSTIEAVVESDLTLIAVPTPFDPVTGKIDLKYVLAATTEVGHAIRKKNAYHVVVVKSTVVPGTTDTAVREALEASAGRMVGRDIGLGVNPEFLSEGTAVADFMKPDRIVIGGVDATSIGYLTQLYAPQRHVPTVTVNNATAEMIKYASNTMLATAISFANELARLCGAIPGVDSVDVQRGLHLARYLNVPLPDGSAKKAGIASFFAAGCGFGGSCLPKDTAALVAHGKAFGVDMPVLEAVLKINRGQAGVTVGLLKKHVPDLRGKNVAILGTAFKPDTADLRQSPAEPIIEQLLAEGAVVKTFDPAANADTRRHFGEKITVADTLDEAVRGAAGVIVCTGWPQFADLPAALKRLNADPVVVDGRRMFSPRTFTKYEGIGLSAATAGQPGGTRHPLHGIRQEKQGKEA
jgi:UDPglucose 6-dehydrogenase/GDP-mannose 6-dehydrogenase